MPKLSSGAKDGQDFDKPLNTFIEEEIEVDVVRPMIDPQNPEKKTFVRRKEKFLQKTMYLDVKPQQIMCPDQDHTFLPTQTPNHFACTKCKFTAIAHPHHAKYNPETMKLENRNEN